MDEKFNQLKELILPLVCIACEHCIYQKEDGKCVKDGDCNIKDIRDLIEEKEG